MHASLGLQRQMVAFHRGDRMHKAERKQAGLQGTSCHAPIAGGLVRSRLLETLRHWIGHSHSEEPEGNHATSEAEQENPDAKKCLHATTSTVTPRAPER